MSDAEGGTGRREPGAERRRYHIVLHRRFDVEELTRDAQAGKRPRFGFLQLAEELGATVHTPGSHPVSAWDRLRARVYGRAEGWAMARALRTQIRPGDVVCCIGEEVAFPIAVELGSGLRRAGIRIATFVHNVGGPRSRLLMGLYGLRNRIALFIANNGPQTAVLRDRYGIPEAQRHQIAEQTDVRFFTPGPPTPGKARPVVASVGLEQRDYRTLAEATRDLDVDVRISGFSTDAAAQARAFPDTLPANMTQAFYEWTDLVQLYRDAEVVAVSLFPCHYSAGVTTLLEGFACRRPVVVTRTDGLAEYLDPATARITPQGDAAALRAAIGELLADPAAANSLAERGYRAARERYDSDRFVAELAGLVRRL